MTDSSRQDPQPLQVIGERYSLLRQLREEPWGDIWLAQDRLLEAEVGLKLLPAGDAQEDRIREFYKAEAALAPKLRYPGILGAFHLGEAPEGLYLVEEPFSGESLMAEMARQRHFSLPQAVAILEEAALALAAAHRRGVVHQSFSPLHVLLKGNEVRVAHFAFPPADREELFFLELKAYHPPEVLRGETLSPASNIFSLGVLGFRLVAGSLPYPLTFDETLPYRLEIPLSDLNDVPLAWQNLLLRCLALEPEDRFQDAGEFITHLSRIPGFPTARGERLAFGAESGSIPEWRPRLASLGSGARRLGQKALNTAGIFWSSLSPGRRRLGYGLGLGVLAVIVLLAGMKLFGKTGQISPTRRSPVPPLPTAATFPPPPKPFAKAEPPKPRGAPPLKAAPTVDKFGTPLPAPSAPQAKPAKKDKLFVVVAGRGLTKKQAQNQKERLQAKGFKAHLQATKATKTTKAGKKSKITSYQVLVGPVSKEKQATALARLVRVKTGITATVRPTAAASKPARKAPAKSKRVRA